MSAASFLIIQCCFAGRGILDAPPAGADEDMGPCQKRTMQGGDCPRRRPAKLSSSIARPAGREKIKFSR